MNPTPTKTAPIDPATGKPRVNPYPGVVPPWEELSPEQLAAQARINEILSRRHNDPDSPGNLAERHNEHQP